MSNLSPLSSSHSMLLKCFNTIDNEEHEDLRILDLSDSPKISIPTLFSAQYSLSSICIWHTFDAPSQFQILKTWLYYLSTYSSFSGLSVVFCCWIKSLYIRELTIKFSLWGLEWNFLFSYSLVFSKHDLLLTQIHTDFSPFFFWLFTWSTASSCLPSY